MVKQHVRIRSWMALIGAVFCAVGIVRMASATTGYGTLLTPTQMEQSVFGSNWVQKNGIEEVTCFGISVKVPTQKLRGLGVTQGSPATTTTTTTVVPATYAHFGCLADFDKVLYGDVYACQYVLSVWPTGANTFDLTQSTAPDCDPVSSLIGGSNG